MRRLSAARSSVSTLGVLKYQYSWRHSVKQERVKAQKDKKKAKKPKAAGEAFLTTLFAA